MSEPLMEHNTQDNETYSQPDSLASPFLWPGSKAAKMITASSGLKLLELCEKRGQGGAFLKTFLGCSEWSSRIRYLNWKAKRIAYFQKTKKQAIPLTDELSGESLKTLSKRDMYYPAQPMARQSFLLFRLSPSRPSIGEIGCGSLPTPTTTNASHKTKVAELVKNGKDSMYKRMDGMEKPTLSITDALNFIRLTIPTPQAGDAKSGDMGRKRKKSGKQMNMATVIAEMKAIEVPTPCASDYKSEKTPNGSEKRDNTPGAMIRMGASSLGQTIRPQFYELLMGFPPGWCDLSEPTVLKP